MESKTMKLFNEVDYKAKALLSVLSASQMEENIDKVAQYAKANDGLQNMVDDFWEPNISDEQMKSFGALCVRLAPREMSEVLMLNTPDGKRVINHMDDDFISTLSSKYRDENGILCGELRNVAISPTKDGTMLLHELHDGSKADILLGISNEKIKDKLLLAKNSKGTALIDTMSQDYKLIMLRDVVHDNQARYDVLSEIVDDKGNTRLHRNDLIAEGYRGKFLEQLSKEQAMQLVTQPNEYGETPMHGMQRGDYAKYGAGVVSSLKDKNGKSPIDWESEGIASVSSQDISKKYKEQEAAQALLMKEFAGTQNG